MILCDKCEKYLFPEIDEDNCWSAGCTSPSVVSIFLNFFRLKKCKYYKKISYPKLLERCKFVLGEINSYSFHYRDKKYKGKSTKWVLKHLNGLITDYIEFRDYLFSEIKKSVEVWV